MPATTKFTRESDFRRERDFGAKFGATFEFVTAQFRPLVKCLAYFVLPGALVGGIGLGLVMGKFLTLAARNGRTALGGSVTVSQPFGANPFLDGASMLGFGLAALGFLAAFLLLTATVYGFVRVRLRTPPAEPVQPHQVWAVVWGRLGSVVGAWLLLSVVLVIGMGVVGGALALLGPGFVLLLFPVLLWLIVCLTLYFPALWMEDAGVVAAFRRSFYLIKGKWWSTLGLYVVMSLVTGIINYLFLIPMYALMMARMLVPTPSLDSNLLNVAATSVYALGWIFTAVLPLVAMLFQYFNLVERRDGVGLRQLVSALGQTPVPQVSSAAYRPDEEGEY